MCKRPKRWGVSTRSIVLLTALRKCAVHLIIQKLDLAQSQWNIRMLKQHKWDQAPFSVVNLRLYFQKWCLKCPRNLRGYYCKGFFVYFKLSWLGNSAFRKTTKITFIIYLYDIAEHGSPTTTWEQENGHEWSDHKGVHHQPAQTYPWHVSIDMYCVQYIADATTSSALF